MSTKPSNIIVIGASYSGIAVAHKLLKRLAPNYHVILIDPSTEFYWNIAAPRGLVKQNIFSSGNSQMFHPIAEGFTSYPPTRFTFIQGRATNLTPTSKTILISRTTDDGTVTSTETLSYTQLVIASGASVGTETLLPFKPIGSHVQTRQAIQDMQTQIEAARTIVISGAGPTGVETAGEIATLWPTKKVILVSALEFPLPTGLDSVQKSALRQLESLNVEVKKMVKVINGDVKTGGGPGILELSDGTTIHADLHIPTHGLVPNTAFVPEEMRSSNGSVLVTSALRSPSFPDVWALGDAADVKHKYVQLVGKMSEVVVVNLLSVVKGESTQREYDDAAPPAYLVPIGGGFAMGTGQFGSWRTWGFIVWLFKGRGYFIGSAKSVAEGKVTAAREKI